MLAGGFAGLLVGFFLVVGLVFIFWGLLIAYREGFRGGDC